MNLSTPTQMLLFDVQEPSETHDDIIAAILSSNGSQTVGWKRRLLDFWKLHADSRSKADFLKDEFGIGGRCRTGEDVRWDGSGLGINYASPWLTFTRKLKWEDVAVIYDGMVSKWGEDDQRQGDFVKKQGKDL